MSPGCADAIDIDDFSQSCPDETLDVQPGQSLTLEFEPYAYGTFAGTYGVEPDVDFDPQATVSATEVELDGVPVPVTLEFTLPVDACGAEFAGIDITRDDGEGAGSSVTLSIVDGAGGLVFCGE